MKGIGSKLRKSKFLRKKWVLVIVLLLVSSLVTAFTMHFLDHSLFGEEGDIESHFLLFLVFLVLIGLIWFWLLYERIFPKGAEQFYFLVTVSLCVLTAIIFTILRFGIRISTIDAAHWLYVSTISIFILLWLMRYAVKSFEAIPPLKFKAVRIDTLEDALSKQFKGKKKGINWVFENIRDVDYSFRTRVDKELLVLPLNRLFKAVIALHNYNKFPGSPIPLEFQGSPLGWEFFTERAYSKDRIQLDPGIPLWKKFFFFRRTSDKSVPVDRMATVYVKCVKLD